MKGRKAHRRAASVAVGVAVAGLGLGGCMVGPDYQRPEAEVNPSWLESSGALR